MKELLEQTVNGLRAALMLNPDNGPLWLQVANLCAELGRKDEAVAAARTASALLPPDARGPADSLLARFAPPVAPQLAAASAQPTPDDSRKVVRLVRGGAPDAHASPGEPEPERVTFADVAGLTDVKEAVRMRIVLPFQRPDVFAAYGKKRGGGILVYGPPGCGKTLVARAVAGEVGATFRPVKIEDVLDMYYGESERRLAAIFDDARRRAPTVLFFDEVEAIGASRQQIRNSPGRSLVNQLLSELDGFAGGNERLLVVAATNAPWHVDPALLRPGRFDRVVFVPPPDVEGRQEVLRLHLDGRPTGALDLAAIARKTDGWSGADLADLVERATERPLKEALGTGQVRPIEQRDLEAAATTGRPSTAEWFATAKNYATFANVSGLYDDLAAYLDKTSKRRR